MINPMTTENITPATDSLDFHEKITEVTEYLSTTPTDQLISDLLDKALGFSLKVVAALVIYAIGLMLIRWLKNMLRRIFEKKNTDPAIMSFVMSMTTIGSTILLIVVTIGVLGVDTTSFAALLAAGGMAIGMALSGTVQNFAGGIMLLVFRPFKAGDFINAQNFSGTVSEVSIFSTKLITPDNRSIIIPNGVLSNNTIDNFSQNPFRRIEWVVDVEYGSDCDLTKKILLDLVTKYPKITSSKDGAPTDPVVVLASLEASSVRFKVRAWVKNEDFWDTTFDLNEQIYKELPKNNINFPFNQLEVHLKKS